MANVNIPDLTSYTNPDRVNDVLEIYDNTNTTNKKITINSLLGTTGAPVGTTDTQVISNKTIGNTNTVTLKGSLFILQDASDTSKQAQFVLSGITTATTRSYTLPNASGTLVDLASSQTLTNKTLTSPVITGGSYDNGTITVDSISGHTSATIVTVGGVQMNNGTIGTANAVTNSSIADAAVTPAKLLAGTGSGWSWAVTVPTWTNLTVGNAVQNSKFIQTGKTVTMKLDLTFGSTTTMGSNPTFTLPVTAVTYPSTLFAIGAASYITSGGSGAKNGFIAWNSTTSANLRAWDANNDFGAVTSTLPFTWAAGYIISALIVYEAA